MIQGPVFWTSGAVPVLHAYIVQDADSFSTHPIAAIYSNTKYAEERCQDLARAQLTEIKEPWMDHRPAFGDRFRQQDEREFAPENEGCMT
jgi:hypothetical protein